MFFFYLNANPLCYEGLRSLCFPSHSIFGHIFSQNALACAVWWPFEHVFLKNAPILLFRHPIGHDFLKNVTVCCREHKFGCVLFKMCERKGLATAEAQMEFLKVRRRCHNVSDTLFPILIFVPYRIESIPVRNAAAVLFSSRFGPSTCSFCFLK